MDRAEYLARWSALHGGVKPRGLVGGWLLTVYPLARPLAARGVPPAVPTLVAVVLAGSVPLVVLAGGRWLLLAVLIVVVSAALDGVDGAVAVMSHRVTAKGAVLDGFCDRISDLCFIGALWAAGSPVGWCVAGGAIALLHEHLRAGAKAAGMSDVGAVTVSERPTRVIVTAAFLLGAGLHPGSAAGWATAGAVAWIGAGLIGLAQLAQVVRKRL